MTIEEIIQKYPNFSFLKSPRFKALPKEKQDFFVTCVEDAIFWVELEKKPQSSEGFKFLAAQYGLQKAEKDADDKGLQGKEKEEFLKSHKELFAIFNPFGGIASDDFTKETKS